MIMVSYREDTPTTSNTEAANSQGMSDGQGGFSDRIPAHTLIILVE